MEHTEAVAEYLRDLPDRDTLRTLFEDAETASEFVAEWIQANPVPSGPRGRACFMALAEECFHVAFEAGRGKGYETGFEEGRASGHRTGFAAGVDRAKARGSMRQDDGAAPRGGVARIQDSRHPDGRHRNSAALVKPGERVFVLPPRLEAEPDIFSDPPAPRGGRSMYDGSAVIPVGQDGSPIPGKARIYPTGDNVPGGPEEAPSQPTDNPEGK